MAVEETDYCVRLSQHGTKLGAGFILNRYFALTAAHCLKGKEAGDEDVELTLATGEEIRGRVCELAAGADLALIRVVKSPDHSLRTPVPDLAVRGDTWIAPYRPSSSDPLLQGDVVEGSVAHQCAAGDRVEALQLNCSQRIESYHGYSGGPVERHREDRKRTLFGILIEQSFDRNDGTQVTNVMWAVTMREAGRRFGNLGTDHFLNVLSGREAIPDEHSAVRIPPPVNISGPSPQQSPHLPNLDPGSLIAEIDARMKVIHEWCASGVLSPEDGKVFKLRLASHLVDSVNADAK